MTKIINCRGDLIDILAEAATLAATVLTDHVLTSGKQSYVRTLSASTSSFLATHILVAKGSERHANCTK